MWATGKSFGHFHAKETQFIQSLSISLIFFSHIHYLSYDIAIFKDIKITNCILVEFRIHIQKKAVEDLENA